MGQSCSRGGCWWRSRRDIAWPSQRGTVDVAELIDQLWIVGDAGGSDPLLGVWPGMPGTPRLAYAVRDWPARLGLVAAGLGFAVVPGLAAGTMPPGVQPGRRGGSDARSSR